MLRKLATALVIALLAACTSTAPVPTPPPLATATASSVPTLPATEAPPLWLTHPARIGVGTVDVLKVWCHSAFTTIAVYEYGVTFVNDADGEATCIREGKLS